MGGSQSPTARVRAWIRRAASLYGVDAALLDEMARRESGYRPRVVNTTDSNAAAGHPSRGLFQFIPETFNAYANGARRANPQAWAAFPRNDVNDYRQQALAAAWAVKNGRGSAWSTYQPALDTVKKNGTSSAMSSGRSKWSPMRDAVAAEMQRRGLRHTSGDRTPGHNAQVNGAGNSDHLTTNLGSWADDYVGTQAQMQAGLVWVQQVYAGRGLKQALVDNVGNGWNLHIAGFSSGNGGGASAAAGGQNVSFGGAASAVLGVSPILQPLAGALDALNAAGGSKMPYIGSAIGTFSSAINNVLTHEVVLLALLGIGAALIVYGVTRSLNVDTSKAADAAKLAAVAA